MRARVIALLALWLNLLLVLVNATAFSLRVGTEGNEWMILLMENIGVGWTLFLKLFLTTGLIAGILLLGKKDEVLGSAVLWVISISIGINYFHDTFSILLGTTLIPSYPMLIAVNLGVGCIISGLLCFKPEIKMFHLEF